MRLNMDHSYEEIRRVALDILSGREKCQHEPSQFDDLMVAAAEVVARRANADGRSPDDPSLSTDDRELFREMFWDLFRQGIITLGHDNNNAHYPFFRISRLGGRVLENPDLYFFHDVSSYEKVVRENVPGISEVTLLYAQEAMQAYLSGCILSATVMIGVAAEDAFDSLLEAIEDNPAYAYAYSRVRKERYVLKRLIRFRETVTKYAHTLPPPLKEGLETNLLGIAELIRNFRNDSGHPSGKLVSQEQCYILLNLFVPYCKKVHELMAYFRTPEPKPVSVGQDAARAGVP
jgi:hypothetical protein